MGWAPSRLHTTAIGFPAFVTHKDADEWYGRVFSEWQAGRVSQVDFDKASDHLNKEKDRISAGLFPDLHSIEEVQEYWLSWWKKRGKVPQDNYERAYSWATREYARLAGLSPDTLFDFNRDGTLKPVVKGRGRGEDPDSLWIKIPSGIVVRKDDPQYFSPKKVAEAKIEFAHLFSPEEVAEAIKLAHFSPEEVAEIKAELQRSGRARRNGSSKNSSTILAAAAAAGIGLALLTSKKR